MNMLLQRGYEEYEVPVWLSWDQLGSFLPSTLYQSTLKLVDGADRVMALRSDFTASLALSLSNENSGRFCYTGPVFRREHGTFVSLEQTGCEHIGENCDSDGEILATAIASLLEIGVRNFAVVVNDASVMEKILQHFEPDVRTEVITLAKYRNLATLKEKIGPALAASLFGATRPMNLLDNVSADCKAELLKLEAIISEVEGYGVPIIFDPFLVRDPGYYTGLLFEIYARGVPQSLGGGGRYDELIKHGGAYTCAAGFALNMPAVRAAALGNCSRSLSYELSGHH